MRRAALAVAAALLVTGCSSGPPDYPDLEQRTSDVDVDTAQLRELKQDAGVEPCEPTDGEAVGDGLPELTLACFGGGKPVALQGLRGPLVVNLWASWCGPCRREMPVLQDFYEQHGDDVGVLGVDWQDPQTSAAMELVVDSGVTYPLVADPDGYLDVVGGQPVRGLPMIVLVDDAGEVVHVVAAEMDSVAELEGLVRDHLGVDL